MQVGFSGWRGEHDRRGLDVVVWDVTPCGLAAVRMFTASTSATLKSGKNGPLQEVKLTWKTAYIAGVKLCLYLSKSPLC